MLKYSIGNWLTGEIDISEASNDLPVIHGSDEVVRDINGQDVLNISVSKLDLPNAEWQEYLTQGQTMIVLYSTETVSDSYTGQSIKPVLFAGEINKISGEVGDVIRIQAVGPQENLKLRTPNRATSGVITNPNSGWSFSGDSWTSVMGKVIRQAFTPMRFSPSQPPVILGNVEGSLSTGSFKTEGLLIDNKSYFDIIETIKNELSNGIEYRFRPRFTNQTTGENVVFDVQIGTAEQPHINFDTILSRDLSSSSKMLQLSVEKNAEGQVNQLIGISKMGDPETGDGADITIKTISNGKALSTAYFLPSVELTPVQMEEQLTARLADISKPRGSSTYSESLGDTLSEAEALYSTWVWNRLGANITFATGEGISEGYENSVRITAVKLSASTWVANTDVMIPQSRYPRLPSTQSKGKGTTGFGGGGYGGGYGGGLVTPDSGIPLPPLLPPLIPPNPPVPSPEIEPFHPNKFANGYTFTVGINANNRLVSWGTGGAEMLQGDSLVDGTYLLPTEVPDEIYPYSRTPIAVYTTWSTIAATWNQRTYILDDEGRVMVAGHNDPTTGPAGSGSYENRLREAEFLPEPATNISAIYPIEQLSRVTAAGSTSVWAGRGGNMALVKGSGDTKQLLVFGVNAQYARLVPDILEPIETPMLYQPSGASPYFSKFMVLNTGLPNPVFYSYYWDQADGTVYQNGSPVSTLGLPSGVKIKEMLPRTSEGGAPGHRALLEDGTVWISSHMGGGLMGWAPSPPGHFFYDKTVSKTQSSDKLVFSSQARAEWTYFLINEDPVNLYFMFDGFKPTTVTFQNFQRRDEFVAGFKSGNIRMLDFTFDSTVMFYDEDKGNYWFGGEAWGVDYTRKFGPQAIPFITNGYSMNKVEAPAGRPVANGFPYAPFGAETFGGFITDDSATYVTGSNNQGQLGLGDTANHIGEWVKWGGGF